MHPDLFDLTQGGRPYEAGSSVQLYTPAKETAETMNHTRKLIKPMASSYQKLSVNQTRTGP